MKHFEHNRKTDRTDAVRLVEISAEQASESPPWESMYLAAKRHYQDYGSLDVPDRFPCQDGVCLGAWLAQQRRIRAGLAEGVLTEEQIMALDGIGMTWDVSDYVFERNYSAAAVYYREHGDLECKPDYVDSSGVKLGAWLVYLRSQYKKRGRFLLTAEQFRMLDEIGMRWGSKHDVQWDAYFKCLVSYLERTGNKDVPATWKENGIQLGRWLRRQRELYAVGELRQDRVIRLQALGLELTGLHHRERKMIASD